jgi:hypothetical protein
MTLTHRFLAAISAVLALGGTTTIEAQHPAFQRGESMELNAGWPAFRPRMPPGAPAAGGTAFADGQGAAVPRAIPDRGIVRGLYAKCLDVQQGSTALGTKLHMWTCHSGPAQQWEHTAAGEIRGLGGKCLDVQWARTTPGTPVHMWDCNGSPAQKFSVSRDGAIMGLGGLGLDVRGGSTARGAPVQMWHCNGTPAQRWGFSVPGTNRGDRLQRNTVLYEFDHITSNGRTLVMQGDCNLVLYERSTALWASNTMNFGRECYAIMQGDGNLVVYNESHRALWASGTNRYPGGYAVLQSDGNFVIYQNGCARWSTDTARETAGSVSGSHPGSDPSCRFSRTETKCAFLVMLCRHVYNCGFDSNLNPIDRPDSWSACGACVGWSW